MIGRRGGPPADPAARRPRFSEGLVAGALIGAAIAGSTLWSKLRRSRSTDRSIEPAPPPQDEGPGPG